jgi:hypothetical protein
MTILKKIKNKILGYFPVTTKTYDSEIRGILENIDLIVKSIKGFRLAEKQLSTMNAQILEKLNELNEPKVSEKDKNSNNKEHVEFG